MKIITKVTFLTVAFAMTVNAGRAQWAVVVIEDIFRQLRWIEEDALWSEQLGNLEFINQQIGTTNSLLGQTVSTLRDINRKIGEPAESSARAFGSVSLASSASERYIRNELSLETVMADDDGGATLLKTNHTTKSAIGKTFEISGEKYERDQTRYRLLQQEEKLRDNYKKALTDFHDVQKKELDFQQDQTKAFQGGVSTQTEIESRHAAIESSRGRVEMAKNRMELAKAELEAFAGQLDLEERKVEAARWEEKDKAKSLATDQNTRTKRLLGEGDENDEFEF